MKKQTTRLTVETLEDRNLLSWGLAWPNAGHITLSFVPDGTNVDSYQSGLIGKLNTLGSARTWEMEILRALQTWAVNANINIGLAADGGQALGSSGQVQGDTRFGDIRVASEPLGTAAPLAITSPYDPVAGTRAGDMVFNSAQAFSIGSAAYDLFTTALHEAGHVFGLADNTDPTSVEYAVYSGLTSKPSAADIAMLQSLYGARTPDRYAGNNTLATAATIKLPNTAGDITTLGEADYYKFTIPSYANNKVTFTVNTTGISLLTAKLTVYTSTGGLVATTSAIDPLSGDPSITLTNVKRGTRYVLKVEGARNDVFGIGSYRLKINSGLVSQGQIAAIDVLLNGGPANLFDDHHHDDTLNSSSKLDQGVYALDARFNYSINASLSDSSDLDYYSVTTPATAPGALIVTVTAGAGSVLNPCLTVYDADGNTLNAQILSNDATSFVVQIQNPGANTKYFIEVSPDAFGAQGNLTGSYTLGVNFAGAPIVLQTLVNDSLTSTQYVETYALVSNQVQLYHFVLSVDTGGVGVDVAVRMQVFDANNKILLTLDCQDGNTVSANVTLGKGTYYARFVGASKSNGYNIPLTAYQLLGVAVSDPLDPPPVNPTDPTLPPPPPDPTSIVVTNPGSTNLPPVDPTSNPWPT